MEAFATQVVKGKKFADPLDAVVHVLKNAADFTVNEKAMALNLLAQASCESAARREALGKKAAVPAIDLTVALLEGGDPMAGLLITSACTMLSNVLQEAAARKHVPPQILLSLAGSILAKEAEFDEADVEGLRRGLFAVGVGLQGVGKQVESSTTPELVKLLLTRSAESGTRPTLGAEALRILGSLLGTGSVENSAFDAEKFSTVISASLSVSESNALTTAGWHAHALTCASNALQLGCGNLAALVNGLATACSWALNSGNASLRRSALNALSKVPLDATSGVPNFWKRTVVVAVTSKALSEQELIMALNVTGNLLTDEDAQLGMYSASGYDALIQCLKDRGAVVLPPISRCISNSCPYFDEVRESWIPALPLLFGEVAKCQGESCKEAVKALVNLSLCHRVQLEFVRGSSDGIQTLVRCWRQGASQAIQFDASRVMVNVLTNPEARTAALRLDVLPHVIAWVISKDSPEKREQGAKILTNLSISSEARRYVKSKQNLMKTMSAFASSTPGLRRALDNLAFPVDAKVSSSSPSADVAHRSPPLSPKTRRAAAAAAKKRAVEPTTTKKEKPPPVPVTKTAAGSSTTTTSAAAAAAASVLGAAVSRQQQKDKIVHKRAAPKKTTAKEPAAAKTSPRARPPLKTKMAADDEPPAGDKWSAAAAPKSPRPKSNAPLGKEEDRLKMQEFRTKIAQEMLSTEKSYVQFLRLLVNRYQKPLMSASRSRKPIVNAQTVASMFSGLEVILNYNELLLESLSDRIGENWSDKCVLGDIFLRLSDFLKTYTDYVNNYGVSLDLVEHNRTSSSRFRTFCDRIESEPDSRGQNLQSLLIMPVQRVPRYVLLLGDYLKRTWRSHSDYASLSTALDKMKSVAAHINSMKDVAEKNSKLVALRRDVHYASHELDELVKPHRHILKETRELKVGGDDIRKGGSDALVVLMNDSILLAMANRNKLKLRAWIDLHLVKFEERAGAVFSVRDPKGVVHSLFATSETQRAEWMQAISAAAKELFEAADGRRIL